MSIENVNERARTSHPSLCRVPLHTRQIDLNHFLFCFLDFMYLPSEWYVNNFVRVAGSLKWQWMAGMQQDTDA